LSLAHPIAFFRGRNGFLFGGKSGMKTAVTLYGVRSEHHMKAKRAALLMPLVIGVTLAPPAPIRARQTPLVTRQSASALAQLAPQRLIHRHGTPIRVYGRSGYLPPTAVRTCSAWYEQEYRPSGTVIVPRMRCHWVNG
jgi:hypothetical protein